jgi:type I restriction enzyme S subunit
MLGWETKPLGQVCTIKPPKAEARAKLNDDDAVSFAPMEDLGIGEKYLQPSRTRRLDEVSGSYTYFADGDVLLAKITPCFENGKLGVARGLTNGVGFGSSEYIVLRPASRLDAEFLYYYLARPMFLEEGARIMTGAVGHKRVTKEFVESYLIPFPPLPEQRRIVAILDEAFEAIATAKANTEKNLQNARELLDTQLDALLAQGGTGWEEVPISDCFKVRSGDFLPAKNMAADGNIPVYGGNGIAGSHDAANLKGDHIVIGRVGAKCGNVRHVTGEIWLTDNAFHISNYLRPFDSAFLARVLKLKNLRQTANQAAQPVISYTTIKDVVLSFPSGLDKQREIASSLESLQDQVERLEALHQQKVVALDELKQTLLHQAFTGKF